MFERLGDWTGRCPAECIDDAGSSPRFLRVAGTARSIIPLIRVYHNAVAVTARPDRMELACLKRPADSSLRRPDRAHVSWFAPGAGFFAPTADRHRLHPLQTRTAVHARGSRPHVPPHRASEFDLDLNLRVGGRMDRCPRRVFHAHAFPSSATPYLANRVVLVTGGTTCRAARHSGRRPRARSHFRRPHTYFRKRCSSVGKTAVEPRSAATRRPSFLCYRRPKLPARASSTGATESTG